MIIIQIALTIACFFSGFYVSILWKTISVYRKVLMRETIIRAFIGGGEEKLAFDYSILEPTLGSIGVNIEIWEKSQFQSLYKPARLFASLFILCFVPLTLLAGWWSLLGFLGLLWGSVSTVTNSSFANIGSHMYRICLYILKWNDEDPAACEAYCLLQMPKYAKLYQVLLSLANRTREGDAIVTPL